MQKTLKKCALLKMLEKVNIRTVHCLTMLTLKHQRCRCAVQCTLYSPSCRPRATPHPPPHLPPLEPRGGIREDGERPLSPQPRCQTRTLTGCTARSLPMEDGACRGGGGSVSPHSHLPPFPLPIFPFHQRYGGM